MSDKEQQEEHGFVFQLRGNGGSGGAEKEKSDDRPETRGGFPTATERMQDPTAWFVSDLWTLTDGDSLPPGSIVSCSAS